LSAITGRAVEELIEQFVTDTNLPDKSMMIGKLFRLLPEDVALIGGKGLFDCEGQRVENFACFGRILQTPAAF